MLSQVDISSPQGTVSSDTDMLEIHILIDLGFTEGTLAHTNR